MVSLLLIFWRTEAPKPQRKTPVRTPSIYNFRRTILDKLDWYFAIIKRLKKGDRETYSLYSKFGAAVLSDEEISAAQDEREISSWWQNNRPSFGAFFLSNGSLGDDLQPTFLCFRKYKKSKIPPEIQRAKGDIYVVTVCWDYEKWAMGMPTEFAIAIDSGSKITVLRTKTDIPQTIRATKKNRGSTFSVPNRKFRIEKFFVDWAEQHQEEEPDVYAYLAHLFTHAANMYAAQNSEMTKIKVTKGRCCAIFSIDILRTPYFFKDRDLTVLVNGRRKPIFHIVRAHRRIVKGAETFVRTHFRGEKKFLWNGYGVRITVPGWHHLDLADFDAGAHHVSDDEDVKADYLDMGDLGSRLTDFEDTGVGKHVRHARQSQ